MSRRLRIMVVDDDDEDLDRTLQAIREHGLRYEARVARDGFEALDYLYGRGRFHERSRHPLPDLVLLDYDMAPIDGVQVLRRMKPMDFLRRIPVVLLCGSEQERERAIQAAVPACTCAVKPLSAESLHAMLRELAPWTLESSPKVYVAMRSARRE